MFFARSITLESEEESILEATHLTTAIDDYSIKDQNLQNKYRPRSAMKKKTGASLPRENFELYKNIQRKKIDSTLGLL